MSSPRLEEVFKLSGIPTFTFVKPREYDKLLVALRTPGRGLVVEGPSGIGKTVSVSKALNDLGLDKRVQVLSARKKSDREYIGAIPDFKGAGVVIIDDFHRLPDDQKSKIADFMKTLADEEDHTTKLILIGINKAGDSLVKFAKDLNDRIDTLHFEANPEEKLFELVALGEGALNISISSKDEIVANAQGSFHLAQMLCSETCVGAGITEKADSPRTVNASFEVVNARVLENLARVFFKPARDFAAGPKLRREGRAPYLHILNWLANGDSWAINLEHEVGKHPAQRGSVGQVVEKGYLDLVFKEHPEFSDVLHYDSYTRIIGIEDPKFMYYLRNLLWSKFAKQVGFLSIEFDSKYDFALSFAGRDRETARLLMEKLQEHEFEVFYDKNEEHRILAENIEDYLGPIYRSEAKFVIALLSSAYPQKLWTKFESSQFKDRFGTGSVIPILFSDAPPGAFDETSKIGSFMLDADIPVEPQISRIADVLSKKISELRVEAPVE